jgi:hypothetical protein
MCYPIQTMGSSVILGKKIVLHLNTLASIYRMLRKNNVQGDQRSVTPSLGRVRMRASLVPR